MLRWFIDKDGNKLEIDEVLEKGLMLDEYPHAYLVMAGARREWTGVPSTTQLINGTREEFLKIVTDWYVKPSESAFMILGTRAHASLETVVALTDRAENSEVKFVTPNLTGIADCLEELPDGTWELIDYKTWGSYKVGKAIGLVERKVPELDDGGNQILLRSGKNKGQPKMRSEWDIDPGKAELREVTLQLNAYRDMAEQLMEIEVSRLRVFVVVRDGGTHIAKSRGMTENVYYIDIPFMDNTDLRAFFELRGALLVKAVNTYRDLESGGMSGQKAFQHCMPEICSMEECWDWRKCRGYCSVAGHCAQFGDHPFGAEILGAE